MIEIEFISACSLKLSSPIEQSIAIEMARLAKKYETKFQLALGDNFYTSGITDVDDKRFKVCRNLAIFSIFYLNFK